MLGRGRSFERVVSGCQRKGRRGREGGWRGEGRMGGRETEVGGRMGGRVREGRGESGKGRGHKSYCTQWPSG